MFELVYIIDFWGLASYCLSMFDKDFEFIKDNILFGGSLLESLKSSGYYCWRKCELFTRDQERERLIPKVHQIHQGSRRTYGCRRVSHELGSLGNH